MNRRHILTLTLAFLVPGCPETHSTYLDTGLLPDAGALFDTTAPRDSAATDAPVTSSSEGGLDAPTAIDAPRSDAPGVCDGLAPAACLGAFCVPVFDDACCRVCAPGGPCADCMNLEYHACEALEASPCRSASSCGTAPIWGCGPAAPFCDAANVVDLDSCDVTGCVPAYPAGTGDPDMSMASCVPIVAESCTVMCRRVAPPCPDGMTPEGDGFCYTDRCIPAFVCGR